MGSAPVVEGYRRGCNPGDVSHSFIREAISVCLALRISSSRSIPGGNVSACSLRRFASSASRFSKENVCLIRRRSMAIHPDTYGHK
jgi:hypothetical protein